LIAEIIPEAYDATGRKVFRPDLRRKGPRPTFPMGRYIDHPLSVQCESIRDVRKFLATCRSVPDEEQFGKEDYWQPPEQFEQTRKGDCDDYALWTWRQFLAMGYDARVVFGRHGRYGIGHAWVSFCKDGKCFLVEPQFCRVGETFPRLSTLRYKPKWSVGCAGKNISFYEHEDRQFNLTFRVLLPLVGEWIWGWGRFWCWALPRIPLGLCRIMRRRLSSRFGK
jgi:Transglutaminase-like superfamily